MSKYVVALILLAGIGQVHAATGGVAVPFFGCTLTGEFTRSIYQNEFFVVRNEAVSGPGTIRCSDTIGRTTEQKVTLYLESSGVGPAFNASLLGSQISTGRVGVTSLDGMAGRYQISLGGRLGLLAARGGALVGFQDSSDGSGGGFGFKLTGENRASFGVDIVGSVLHISPVSPAVRTN